MAFRYSKLSIKQKLQAIMMAEVVTVLLLSCGAFATYDLVVARNSLRADLESVAEIVGSDSTAALSFEDQKSAEELLSGLRAKRHLVVACLYSADRKLFASYRRPDLGKNTPFPQPGPEGSQFEPNRFILFHRITLDGRPIGTLYLEADLGEMHERLVRFVGIVGVVLLSGSLVALALSSRLQGFISTPILHLAGTARRVSAEKDYAIRAIRQNDDELGALIDDFNEMLQQIQRQDGELKSALQMKSDFVSFATHQLRTPLAGIKWSLELAAQGEMLSEETAAFIQDGRDSAQRLIGMVNDLLDVSRLESGKLKLAPKETNLAELTRSVLKDVSREIERQRHHLSVTGMETMPPVVVDPQLFRQVILNMVSNAIKYTPSGGRIAICMSQEDGQVRWTITDSGIGIPKANQARLFEKFYRAENVYRLETEGTGLGLHLVKLIVEKSGGRIWCESEENKGSTFQFTIPLGGEKA
jgi:signal transduction histidine kinase